MMNHQDYEILKHKGLTHKQTLRVFALVRKLGMSMETAAKKVMKGG